MAEHCGIVHTLWEVSTHIGINWPIFFLLSHTLCTHDDLWTEEKSFVTLEEFKIVFSFIAFPIYWHLITLFYKCLSLNFIVYLLLISLFLYLAGILIQFLNCLPISFEAITYEWSLNFEYVHASLIKLNIFSFYICNIYIHNIQLKYIILLHITHHY